jgi:hypothetical protein
MDINKGIGCLCMICMLLSLTNVNAQTCISGSLRDSLSGKPAQFVALSLLRIGSNEVAATAFSDENGRYELCIKTDDGYFFTLKTQSISYKDAIRNVVIDYTTPPKNLEINLVLAPQIHLLKEAEVSARRPPFMLSGDTIVFQTEAYTSRTDQHLEAVLEKIPGFEILPGGGIKVNGKTIHKVLLNGEEISDAGAGLLTQNLGPDRVQSVEVRFDEQDHRLRESLLSTSDFVVMNIRLKPDFDKSIFGRLYANAGFREKAMPGGAAKLFSLRAKTKLQLLAEWEAFGQKSIFLEHIQNLGAQAIQQIQEMPADFNRIRANPEFSRELYGFRDFVQNQNAAFGITGKFSPFPALDVFLGSFNQIDRMRQIHTLQQSRLTSQARRLEFDISQTAFSALSRNKVEATLSLKDLKISYNFNNRLAFSRQERQQEELTLGQSNFRQALNAQAGFHNLFFEKKWTEKLGLQISMVFLSGRDEDLRRLLHENPFYAIYFAEDSNAITPQEPEQVILSRNRSSWIHSVMQFRGERTVWQFGARLHRQQMDIQKRLFLFHNDVQTAMPNRFSTPNQQAWQIRYQPYVEYQQTLGAFNWNTTIGLARQEIHAPLDALFTNRGLPEWNSTLSRKLPDGGHALLAISQNTSPLSLLALMPGYELLDFQSILIPGRHPIRPQPERVMRFSISTFALAHHGIALEFAGIRGVSSASPSMDFLSEGFIAQYTDQLPNRYYILIGKMAKVFEALPWQIRMEGSIIRNLQYNRISRSGAALEERGSNIGNIDFRMFSAFKEKPYQIEMRLKYSRFSFDTNERGDITGAQTIWNAYLKSRVSFSRDRFSLESIIRQTTFSGLQQSALWLMDFSLNWITSGNRWTIQMNNMWNGRTFRTQELSPVLFSTMEREIFGRNLKIQYAWNLH